MLLRKGACLAALMQPRRYWCSEIFICALYSLNVTSTAVLTCQVSPGDHQVCLRGGHQNCVYAYCIYAYLYIYIYLQTYFQRHSMAKLWNQLIGLGALSQEAGSSKYCVQKFLPPISKFTNLQQNRTKCPPKGTQSAAAYILNCKDAVPIVLTTMLLAMSLLLLIQLPARSEAGTWTSRENTPPPTGNKTFLVLHPLYTGSHVLTLHQITKELIARGHRVVTVRFRDVHNFTLTVDNHQGAMGEGSRRNNFEDILMSVDNSDGSLPYLSQEAEAKFSLPSQVLWAKGDNYVQGFLATKKPFEHGISK